MFGFYFTLYSYLFSFFYAPVPKNPYWDSKKSLAWENPLTLPAILDFREKTPKNTQLGYLIIFRKKIEIFFRLIFSKFGENFNFFFFSIKFFFHFFQVIGSLVRQSVPFFLQVFYHKYFPILLFFSFEIERKFLTLNIDKNSQDK